MYREGSEWRIGTDRHGWIGRREQGQGQRRIGMVKKNLNYASAKLIFYRSTIKTTKKDRAGRIGPEGSGRKDRDETTMVRGSPETWAMVRKDLHAASFNLTFYRSKIKTTKKDRVGRIGSEGSERDYDGERESGNVDNGKKRFK